MTLGLLALSWRDFRPYLIPFRRDAVSMAPLTRMLRLGAPIGIQQQLEFGVFGVVGLFMGWLGPVQMAGHQVALNLASFTFMVPLGVSAAAAVLVGQAVGRGNAAEARQAAAAALTAGPGFMAASALTLYTVPQVLARIYTNDLSVAAMAATLIPIAGVFQIFD